MRSIFVAVSLAVLMVIGLAGCGAGGVYSTGGGGGYSSGGTSSGFQAVNGCSIVANDGQFLGVISTNKYDAKSIINTYGNYGSKYSSTSIFNQYCNYGSKYSNLSAYNSYTSTPPVIYRGTTAVAYLTVNTVLSPRVDPYALIGWLQTGG